MFQGIDRIAIAVKDLDKALAFYGELLGVGFDVFPRNEALGMRGAYSASGLEFIEPTGPDTMLGRFIQERGEGLWAIVLKVKNMDDAIRHFAAKGLEPVADMTFGALREVAFHPKDAFGVEIVLAEYAEKHPAMIAAMNIQGPNG